MSVQLGAVFTRDEGLKRTILAAIPRGIATVGVCEAPDCASHLRLLHVELIKIAGFIETTRRFLSKVVFASRNHLKRYESIGDRACKKAHS